MTLNYQKLPEELRWHRQWVLAGKDDTGQYKAPHMLGPRGLFRVSPTNDLHWKDFETTLECVEQCPPCGLGFVITKKDPFTCIDLDVKNEHNYPNNPEAWTPPDAIERFHRIINAFDSYTELSASGQGYHIWVRGSVGPGLKRDGVEIYSQERFIVCTGNVYLDKPIENRQDFLNILAAEIAQGSEGEERYKLAEVEPTETDEVIWERASTADNADKFLELCNSTASTIVGKEKVLGSFTNYGYPSQSEADLALLSIFAFYTKSNEQVRRMFRATGLGQRAKATKNDVMINNALRVIRSRQETEDLLDKAAQASTEKLVASLRASAPVQATAAPYSALIQAPAAPSTPAYVETAINPDDPIKFPEEFAPTRTINQELDQIHRVADENLLSWPPGFVGLIAQYIYESSPRPVREVSIVSALGLFAGICGKAFIIPQSGLNLYIVLVARSAVGKEAMHSGISNLMNFALSVAPTAMNYVDFTDYASGPALTKAVAANPSFVNVSGEWGRKLERLSLEEGRDGPMQQLRTVMTNLYQKSGPASIVGGIGYSDKEKNVASISGAAYSMIGETTPGKFYDSLTANMMEDGFLSRFTVIEYNGDRPASNVKEVEKPAQYILEWLGAIIGHASFLNKDLKNQLVEESKEACFLLKQFDMECDKEINSTIDEGWRQMWNRAHLKAKRIAAILAVADNYVAPVIYPHHVEWALEVIRRDIKIMRRRIATGDVGVGDASRERKILSILHKYITGEEVAPGYGIPPKMQADGIVPRKYLQNGIQRSSAFTNHKGGSNSALDGAIKSLIDSGYILEMPKDKCLKEYEFTGRCFRIVSLPKY